MPAFWSTSPKASVEAECRRRGRDLVVAGCVDLLEGRPVDDALVVVLGGPAAEQVLAGREGGREGYWPRVWAARGLLHVWEDLAAPAIARATGDESWRVREMAAKVVGRHRVESAVAAIVALRDDPVPRVRAAAERAVEALMRTGA